MKGREYPTNLVGNRGRLADRKQPLANPSPSQRICARNVSRETKSNPAKHIVT